MRKLLDYRPSGFRMPVLTRTIMRNSRSLVHVLLLTILLFSGTEISAQAPLQTQTPLSANLDTDGSSITKNRGSFDPSGSSLAFSPKGEPRFTAQDSSIKGICSDSRESNFSLNGTNTTVRAIVADGSGNLYIGGQFSIANSIVTTGIVKWDGTTLSALGSGVEGSVLAIAVSGSDVYVTGRFSIAGGVPANNVAKWDGNSWSALGTGVQVGSFQSAQAIAVSGNNVHVGGDFNSTSGFPNFIARWDGNSWSSMGSGVRVPVRLRLLRASRTLSLAAGAIPLYRCRSRDV